MSLKRRNFLLFLGAAAGTTALGPAGCQPTANVGTSGGATSGGTSPGVVGSVAKDAITSGPPFKPIKSPLPYQAYSVSTEQQPMEYAQYTLRDDIVLPDGFTYDMIASWGDPVGDSRFGYNNDYLSFVPISADEGYLTINFEYISSGAWEQTYEMVIGQTLPFEAVTKAINQAEGEKINAFALSDEDPLKGQIKLIAREALIDQGLGVIYVQKNADGQWERVDKPTDRRISGIAGLLDGKYLKSTGPATAIFTKASVKGYTDDLGDQIIGTFGNCAGGTTPWGTVLSAEENIQYQVPEAVYSDGSSFEPETQPVDARFGGQGNPFGLAGNKYGWIVEVDPANPEDYGTKHTWIGRYRHEAVGVRAEAGKKLAFYSGCDRRGGHVYKFVSTNNVTDPTDKSNSELLSDGMLYAAKFNTDGTGEWIALNPEAAVDPVLPSSAVGGMVTLPKRPDGGFEDVTDDATANKFKETFKTLGDLYEGSDVEKQGAILIDAHYAANAIGATPTARPEDTEIASDGTLFIAFTSGAAGGDGGPDKSIFVGLKGQIDYEDGWIMKLKEGNNDPSARLFSWEMIAVGGEPADGGIGFANPDNLEFDSNGNLWVVTDMSTGKHNKPVPSGRKGPSGEPIPGGELLGIYGNNSLWQIPLEGEDAGKAKMFAYGPMECELTGPFFTPDSSALFISAQHPGERNGIRKDMEAENRDFAMKTTDGKTFLQSREVPVGSNWPEMTENAPPKPSVVAIRRTQAGTSIV